MSSTPTSESDSPNHQLREFIEAIDRAGVNSSAWEVRTVTIRGGNEWHNLVTDLRPAEDATVPLGPGLLYQSDMILAGRWRVGAQVLRSISTGELILGQHTGALRGRGNAPYSAWWGKDEEGWLSNGWRSMHSDPWTGIIYRATGDEFFEVLRRGGVRNGQVDAHIHRLGWPFDGLDGLVEAVTGLRREARGDYRTTVRMRVPLPVRLERLGSTLEQGLLNLRLCAARPEVFDGTDVGIAAFRRGDLVFADVARPEPANRDNRDNRDNGDNGGEGEALITRDTAGADRVVITLRLGGIRIDGMSLEDPARGTSNPRLLAYSALDGDLGDLKQRLTSAGGKGDSTGFEQAVARLFFLMGFQALHLWPDTHLKHAPDIYAFDPYSANVFAIECTVGAIDASGKLGKLVERATELGRTLGQTVQPVLATAAASESISSADRVSAGRDRIVVLAHQDLNALIELAAASTPLSRVATELQRRIPPNPEVSETLAVLRRSR